LNNLIQEFDSKYAFITQWGVSANNNSNHNGTIRNPQSVVVDSSGDVYVADSNNRRIQKFDSRGNYLMQWGSNADNGQFGNSAYLGIDSSDDIYVANTDNNRIEKFDSNGSNSRFEQKHMWKTVKFFNIS
jgi:tripartite motif-containing protein 71